MKRTAIPPQEAAWGPFRELRYNTEKKLHALVEEVSKVKGAVPGSPDQMVRDMYRAASNLSERKVRGLAPLKHLFDRVARITDIRSFALTLAELDKVGGGGPWGVSVDQDMKDSEKYILYIGQSGLGMPDRDYYLKNDPESVRVRTAYEKHLVRLLKLAGRGGKAAQDAALVLEMETALAKISMSREDREDYDKIYNKKSVAQLSRLTPSVPWIEYFKTLGAEPKQVIVMQPDFFKGVEKVLAMFPISAWQTYLHTHLINTFSSALSPALEKESFVFYGTVLSGVRQMKPVWRRALSAVNGGLDEALGKLYIDAHFSSAAKRKISAMVDDLFGAYKIRIQGLDWMSAATKKKALLKLSQMSRKLGYPDKWKSYRGLLIRPDDHAGNMMRVCAYEHNRIIGRLKKPVDRAEWFISPQTVNAYYSPMMNDIVFPAAILQPPFFSVDGDDAINYGAMGAVIGHEITHGFDNQGAKMDGKGNKKTWWTKRDEALFKKKSQVLVKQFNTYTVAGGLKVNGQLTLGENIADLGGASIAYDAYKLHLAKTGGENINGFTPEQRFFLGLALFERENRRPEAEKTYVLIDTHSPGKFRVNGPASNLPEFYEAFGVKKNHKLYRAPKDRAKIW